MTLHMTTLFPEDVFTYNSRHFNVLCERAGIYGTYNFIVVDNATGLEVDRVDQVERINLSATRDNLVYKWLLTLGK